MMAPALQIQKGPGIAARARCCAGKGLALDDSAEVGIKTGRFGEDPLQHVAIDAFVLNHWNSLKVAVLPKAHFVGVPNFKRNRKPVGFTAIFGQCHLQTIAQVHEILGTGHGNKALAAELLQDRICCVHLKGLSKQAGAADRVEQAEAIDIGREAVRRAHGSCSAQAQQLGLLACSIGVAELLQALFDKIGLIVHFRSFLTRSADNSGGLCSSYKAEGRSMSSNYFVPGIDGAEHGAKAACQYTKYARSGRVADAVRERSLNATPARSISSRSRLSFFVTLTPARWGAYRLASQFSASIGSGGAVLDRTSQNHGQNQQHIEIIAQSGAVLWFCDFASRYARRLAYMRTCAYMCARKARTSEPLQYIVIYHIDIGSVVGSARFWPEPALRAGIENHAFPPVSIKLVGRYVPISACRGLLLGCPGETFGDFGPIGIDRAAAGLDVDQARAIDGYLRVSAGRSGLVGMAMLEWTAQRRRNARYSGNWPLPIGKASACAQVPAGTPPMPPLRISISPCSLPPQTNRIWIRFPRLNHSGTMNRRQGGARRNGWSQIGSGKGCPVRFNPVDAGRGMQKSAGKLHRIAQAIGGRADVN